MNQFPSAKIFASQRSILGLPVCDFSWADAFAFADEVLSLPFGQTVISFLNAQGATLMTQDPEYRAVLDRHVVLPDGYGVDVASWVLHGKMFPANLNVTDFVPALMTYIARPMRVAMIGGTPDILARAASGFKSHAPWHDFIPVSADFFDPARSDDVMAQVHALKVDILIVAMDSPRQEKWIDRHVGPGHARLVLGVGTLFEFMAGSIPRAPAGLRRMRLEWVYRFVQDPARLWKRTLLGLPAFLFHLACYKMRGEGQRTGFAMKSGAGRL